jgi:hypothetical protein
MLGDALLDAKVAGTFRPWSPASTMAKMARMSVEQTDGFTDVDRPDGERLRLRFLGEAARHPDVAAGLVQLLLEATDGNFYEAVTAYARRFALGATYYLGKESVIIEIMEPPTLKPLVNASGGSPRSSASRHPSVPVTRPLDRLHRFRAPSD